MTNQLTIDSGKIYNNLISNLNMLDISKDSTVYKTVQPVIDEMNSFLIYANNITKEFNTTTASFVSLQREAANYNIFRRSFNDLIIDTPMEALKISVDPANVFGDIQNTTLYKKGDVVNIGNISITFLKDAVLSNSTDTPFINAKLSLVNVDTYYIEDGSTYLVTPTTNTTLVPNASLTFTRNIGIVNIQESIEDFRLRIIAAKSLPFRNSNSVLNQLVLEVPGITNIDVATEADSSFNRIYVYTERLYTTGIDVLINTGLIPAVQSVLSDKLDFKIKTEVLSATPLELNINVSTLSSNVSTETVRATLNKTLRQYKNLDKNTLYNLLKSQITDLNKVSIELKSISIFENNLNLVTDAPIVLPEGRFFYISKLSGI